MISPTTQRLQQLAANFWSRIGFSAVTWNSVNQKYTVAPCTGKTKYSLWKLNLSALVTLKCALIAFCMDHIARYESQPQHLILCTLAIVMAFFYLAPQAFMIRQAHGYAQFLNATLCMDKKFGEKLIYILFT